MAEYIDKSALYEKIAQLEELARNRYLETPSSSPFCSRYMTQLNERTVFKHIIADFPADDVAPVITGETSDGYHTFNELYHHRAVLFSVIVKAFPDHAWKSRKHHDGSMYDGMFIVGIETPDGQATYHYDGEPYWDMFECKELEYAPEWDGHTPAQAIARIGKLEPVRHGRWIFGKDLPYSWGQIPKNKYHLYCSECLEQAFNRSEDNDPDFDVETPYCPACGCCVDGGAD